MTKFTYMVRADGLDLTWVAYADTPDEARTDIWAKASAWFGGLDDIYLTDIEQAPESTSAATSARMSPGRRSVPLRLVA